MRNSFRCDCIKLTIFATHSNLKKAMKNKMPSQQIEFMLAPIRDSIAGITYATITSGEVVNFAGYETITFAVYETQDVLKARKTNEFAVCVVSIGRNLPLTIPQKAQMR